MSDLDSTHGMVGAVSTLGGGGIVGAIMTWLRNKESREMRDAFIAMQGDLKRAMDDIKKMADMADKVTRTADKADALHKRQDASDDDIEELKGVVTALTARVTALESKRRK